MEEEEGEGSSRPRCSSRERQEVEGLTSFGTRVPKIGLRELCAKFVVLNGKTYT